MKKDVIAGLGEIGKPILKLLSKDHIIAGFDLNGTTFRWLCMTCRHQRLHPDNCICGVSRVGPA